MTTEEKLNEIFFPYATPKIEKARESQNIDFVHYTSAEAAKAILESGEWWMRHSSTMNDFQEIRHGLNCLKKGRDAHLESLNNLLNNVSPGIVERLERDLPRWVRMFSDDTFITSFSEHHRNKEDEFGRLSMWRAYGGAASVAIILNKQTFLGVSNLLKIYGSPVGYLNEGDFVEEFKHLINSLSKHIDFLRQQPQEELYRFMFNVYRFAILCTKHPGFSEEKEWRIVHSPSNDLDSPLRTKVVPVNGIPQPIRVVPLQDELIVKAGMGIANVVDRILIGPTQYPEAMRKAFVAILERAGIPDSENKVSVSNIPLRT